ncbi:uncharacterized protein FSUBG_12349 [Fusarium subglutinans]|uniref:Uncharacterized protein n=1 Tax=Gibberella subglutinans TaxID=42677 RepID=A0A8H5P468_GIBSU|nr:uncharacterized protein FSUBG_12349 [Fusarium subglutinans]KAF5585760.1 hypothetical protein FSUBG_12349 [Fusarium subglutinans]
MAPSQDPPFDHSKVDFTKIGPRRLHMEAFFRHLGLWHPDEVEELRVLIEPEICSRLQQKGLRQVGYAFFEYYVDKKLWYNILGHHNVPFEDQPWPSLKSIMPPYSDLSEGVS